MAARILAFRAPAHSRRLRSRFMEDTWVRRELPMLNAVVSLVDEGAVAGVEPEVSDIASRCGLTEEEVATSLLALRGGVP
jgi:hypothetical protein